MQIIALDAREKSDSLSAFENFIFLFEGGGWGGRGNTDCNCDCNGKFYPITPGPASY